MGHHSNGLIANICHLRRAFKIASPSPHTTISSHPFNGHQQVAVRRRASSFAPTHASTPCSLTTDAESARAPPGAPLALQQPAHLRQLRANSVDTTGPSHTSMGSRRRTKIPRGQRWASDHVRPRPSGTPPTARSIARGTGERGETRRSGAPPTIVTRLRTSPENWHRANPHCMLSAAILG